MKRDVARSDSPTSSCPSVRNRQTSASDCATRAAKSVRVSHIPELVAQEAPTVQSIDIAAVGATSPATEPADAG